jgi:recombinational DNA repair ATPase RecF
VGRELQDAATALIDCLRQQADQFSRFLHLLTSQRDALVSRNTEELERITAQQEQMIGQAHRLESRRQELTQQLVEYAGTGPSVSFQQRSEGITMAEVGRLVEASRATELAGLQERLRGLQAEFDRRRKVNSTLINESMRCTGETLQRIAQTSRSQATYSQKGKDSGIASQIAVNHRC